MKGALYLNGNDYEAEFTLTRKNAATGAVEADAGHLGLTVRLAATPTGAAIDATLQKALAERASLAGTFFAVIAGADINTKLASFVGKSVWEICTDGATIFAAVEREVLADRRL